FDNSSANLGGRLALLVLLVRVVQLFQTGCTLRPVGVLEATVQAVVSHAVVVAVTRLLMDHIGNLGGQFVGVRLVWILRVGAPPFRLGQNRRQFGALWRRSRIVGRDAPLFLR